MAALGAAGSVAGGAAGIAKAVNDAKAGKRALKESERHKTMEAIAIGKVLYLKAYRKELGLYLKPYPKKRVKLPRRALTDGDLIHFAKRMKIPHFRGVFIRDALPHKGPWKRDRAIVNLDDARRPGTRWIA